MESIGKTVGSRARQRREELKYSQAEVAHRMGVAISTVVYLESGTYDVKLGTLAAYCRVIGLSLSELFAFDKPITQLVSGDKTEKAKALSALISELVCNEQIETGLIRDLKKSLSKSIDAGTRPNKKERAPTKVAENPREQFLERVGGLLNDFPTLNDDELETALSDFRILLRGQLAPLPSSSDDGTLDVQKPVKKASGIK